MNERPMHIAYLSPGWPPGAYPNGITTYVGHMRRELERLGHTVSVFSNEPPLADADRVIAVERTLPMRLRAKLRGDDPDDATFRWSEAIVQALQRLHARSPIDLLEMEESFGWCADVQEGLPIPVVAKLHGPAFLSLVGAAACTDAAQRRIEREGRALSAMRHIASPSATTLDQTVRRYGLKHDGHVLPNPIVEPAALPLWTSERSRPDRLLFVGRFDERKGGDFLLRAFARLSRQRPSLRLVFVGPDIGIADAEGGVQHFAAFAEQVIGRGWRDVVEYLGLQPCERIEALRCDAACVVVCSRWENQPATALEAMLQGCPLLSTDAGSMADIVDDGVTGLLYRAGDEAHFCARALQLLDDPAGAASLGRAARAHVQRVHAPQRIAAEVVALYRSIVAEYAR